MAKRNKQPEDVAPGAPIVPTTQPVDSFAPLNQQEATAPKEAAKKSGGFLDNYIICAIIAVIAMGVGVFMFIPNKEAGVSWGESILQIIVAVGLLVYCFSFLLHKIRHAVSKTVKTLELLEFLTMLVISIALILMTLGVMNNLSFISTGFILGIGMWVRGVIEMVSAYKYHGEEGGKYTLGQLFANIVVLSLGVYVFSIADKSMDALISNIVAGVFIVIGVVLFVVSVVNWRKTTASARKEAAARRKELEKQKQQEKIIAKANQRASDEQWAAQQRADQAIREGEMRAQQELEKAMQQSAKINAPAPTAVPTLSKPAAPIQSRPYNSFEELDTEKEKVAKIDKKKKK